MRTRTLFLAAFATVIGGALFAFDASATSTSEAWRLCERNANCKGSDNGTNVSLCIHGGPAKGKCVQCPSAGKSGSCIVVGKIVPVGGKGPKGVGNPVTGVKSVLTRGGNKIIPGGGKGPKGASNPETGVKGVGTGSGKGTGVSGASDFKPAGAGTSVRRK